jgi:hypothetical protein
MLGQMEPTILHLCNSIFPIDRERGYPQITANH